MKTTIGKGNLRFEAPEVAVWEFPPTRRHITARQSYENKNHYFVSVPYVIFKVIYRKTIGEFKFCSLSVFFRDKPLAQGDDEVTIQPFGNSNSHNGTVCMGDAFLMRECFSDPYQLCETAIAAFWSSSFDDAGSYNKFVEKNGKIIKGLAGLQRATRLDPEVASKIKWHKNSESLAAHLARCCQGCGSVVYLDIPKLPVRKKTMTKKRAPKTKPEVSTLFQQEVIDAPKKESRPATNGGNVQKLHLSGGRLTNKSTTGKTRRNSELPSTRDVTRVPPAPNAGVGHIPSVSGRKKLPTDNVVSPGNFARANRRSTRPTDDQPRAATTPLPKAKNSEQAADYLLGRQVCRVLMSLTYQLQQLAKTAKDQEGQNAIKSLDKQIKTLSQRFSDALPAKKNS